MTKRSTNKLKEFLLKFSDKELWKIEGILCQLIDDIVQHEIIADKCSQFITKNELREIAD